MSYAKSYLNMRNLANTIVESTVKAGPKGYAKRVGKGLASKYPSVGKLTQNNKEMQSILDLNPILATQVGIHRASNSVEPPVRVARMDTALINGVATEFDMYKFKPNKDGTALIPLSENESTLKKIQEEGDGIPSKSVTRIKEYDTEISKKLVIDLKKAFPELTQKQIGAIIGNLHHESAGFKRYQQVMGEGVSYAQWSGDRKKQFLKFAKDNNLDPKGYEAGSMFLIEELKNNKKHGFANTKFFEAFNNPDASVSELTEIFENNYLAAGKKLMPDRIKDAEVYASEDEYPYVMENE